MQGRVVHTWDTGDDPCLLDDGDVLDWTTDTSGDITGLQELDWNSDVVWSYTETNPAYHLHGDFERIFDPDLNEYTTLFLANKDETYAQLVAAGANPATTPSTGGQMDAIVEVDMSGNVVWEWDFFDHLVQDQYPSEGNYAGSGKNARELPGQAQYQLDGNPPSDDWLDCNSIDFNQSLDQIVVNSSQGEFYNSRTAIRSSPETRQPASPWRPPRRAISFIASATRHAMMRDPRRRGELGRRHHRRQADRRQQRRAVDSRRTAGCR